jgi:hypothetical protein
MLARRRFLSGGGKFIVWAVIVGFVVAALSYPLCRALHRLPSVVVGVILGLLIPVTLGWLWGRLAEPWGFPQRVLWTGLDAWIAGVELSIPSALAGAVVGYLQARNEITEPV